MIANLKPYPAYKDSGVSWLGEVPVHWEVKPLKRWVSINAAVLPDTTAADYQFRYIDIGTVGTGFLIREPQQMRFGDAPSRARRVLRRGDTIVSTVRTYLKAVYHVDRDVDALVCSTGFAVLTPGPGTQPRYVSYLAQSSPFTDCISAESVGTAYPAIAESRLGSFHVPVPTPWEQSAIVRFLDYMDRRIRRYIRAKQKLIKLLEEYKQVLIHRAVTGSIDVRTGQPYPAYKDSGVEWLGQVPGHWGLTRLKHICARSALYGANIPVEKYSLNGVRFLRTTDITDDGQLRKGGVFVSEAMVRNYLLKTGDILISRSGTIGRAFLFNENKHSRCAYAGYLVRFVPGRNVIPSFLFRFTQTQSFAGFLSVMAISSTIENVNGEKYANCHIPLPPLPEQNAIVHFLDTQTTKIDTAIAAARREIELLREYRTRLIADVVTGKVDVREVAARLPEESPEEEAESMDADEIAGDEATDEEAGTETVEEEEVEP